MRFIQNKHYISVKGEKAICVGFRIDGTAILENTFGILINPHPDDWLCLSMPEGWRKMNIPFHENRMVGYVIPWVDGKSIDDGHLSWQIDDVNKFLANGHRED